MTILTSISRYLSSPLIQTKISDLFRYPTRYAPSQVVHAQRHGFVPRKQCHKISFRFWVRGIVTTPQDMITIIKYFKQDHIWDVSIYKGRRKLACVGGVKGGDDMRVLRCDVPAHLEWCVCQRLEGGETPMEAPEDIKRMVEFQSARTASVAPPDWEEIKPHLETAGFRDLVYIGRRPDSIHFTAGNLGVDCPCCVHIHDSQVRSKGRKF